MGDVVLEGRGLTKFYGVKRQRAQVLFGIDVRVHEGECLAVIGGSGSGKTTLTRVLLGLEPMDGGGVFYEGRKAVGDVAQELRRRSGLVFQDPFGSLDPRWRIGESVEEPLRLHHRDWTDGKIVERADESLHMAGLDPSVFRNRFPMELSGGQAQRAAIARAIADRPKVLLADEPMSAIDVDARVLILESFESVRKANPQMALIMVSHDLGVVRHIADTIMVMRDGHVEETGMARDVLVNPSGDYAKRLVAAASL